MVKFFVNAEEKFKPYYQHAIVVVIQMTKRMLKCIETVIMDYGTQTFTKDALYRPYKYMLKDGWDVREVLCAKNDQNDRHIIRDPKDKPMDQFFTKHFEEVLIDGKAK